MKLRARSRLWGAVLAAAASGCADEPPAPVAAVDSTAAMLVENDAPGPGERLGWTVGSKPELSIGTTEGADAEQLFGVRDATVLTGGRLAVANGGSGEVRVFDSAGRHLLSMGGAGEGPGEFRRLTRVETWAADSIFTWDARQRRVSIFDARGAHGRTFRVRDFEDTFSPELLGITRDRRLLVRSGFPRRDDTPYRGMYRADRRYALVDAAGRHDADLGVHPGREGFLWARAGLESTMEHPHGKSTHAAVWGELILISPNDTYALGAYDPAGRLVRLVRMEHASRAPARADMDAWFAEFTAADTPEERAEALLIFEDYPLLDAFPAFERIVVDRLDHVWVRDFDVPGAETPTWVVFDPEGRVLGRVASPAGLEIYEIGADYLLGRARDELDVESVQRWALGR